ncbi:MAG: hypothetical protein N3H32_00380 [Nitrososphaeria archaeon]|nr:hypothetical protein [Nitrososphaeria archaeon]MDW8043864.1 hypothetical protein [Nitrososphaerota archaeon]
MRWAGVAAIGAALILLLTAFSSSGSVSEGFGLSLAREVTFRVLMSEDGRPRPVEGALVALGLEKGMTGGDGTFRFSAAPGRYSSYVKLPDSRFAVVVLEVRVERDLTVEMTFEIKRVRLEEVRLTVGENGTKIEALVAVPEAARAFASSPVVLAYLSDGSPVRLAPYREDFGYFGQSLVPGAIQEVEVEVEERVAAVVPSDSYVPVQLVAIKVY